MSTAYAASIRPARRWLTALSLSMLLAACGGGGGSDSGGSNPTPAEPGPTLPEEAAMGTAAAQRMLDQATFGPSETSIAAAAKLGPMHWLQSQFAAPVSQFRSYSAEIHTAGLKDFCKERNLGDNCWRDYYSAEPLVRDFYVQAVSGSDQLRQRVAFALSQIWVVSNHEVEGTYGLRDYHQMLRDNAFGNVRTLLRKVALHPVMGTFLNMVNNEKAAPNENFARELMQLFTIGPCQLTDGAELAGGACQPTYDNTGVREVAFSLTGWTYPAGGVNPWGSSGWKNPTYLKGEMTAVAAQHDQTERNLPGGVVVPATRTPQVALDAVIDSLFNHPNIAPFLSHQLIQHLVTSNPKPDYVARVSAAFASGTAYGFGSGQRGDMKAILAAILLDPEARDASLAEDPKFGRLREPAQLITNLLRALNGRTDGTSMYWWWGSALGEMVYNAPSVFNFYPPDYPLPGTALVAPQFGIENAATTMQRLNLINGLLYWTNGIGPDTSVPGSTGSQVDLTGFQSSSDDAAGLVDRVSTLLTGGRLSDATRSQILAAVTAWDPVKNKSNYKQERVRTAFYLVLASPDFQVQR